METPNLHDKSQAPKIPFDINDLDLDAIRNEVVNDRPFGAASAPKNEGYDFENGGTMSHADKKALQREDQTGKFKAANDEGGAKEKAA